MHVRGVKARKLDLKAGSGTSRMQPCSETKPCSTRLSLELAFDQLLFFIRSERPGESRDAEKGAHCLSLPATADKGSGTAACRTLGRGRIGIAVLLIP